MIIDLKMENYQELLNSDKVVILDFYLIPCGPCESMLTVLEKIDEQYKGEIIIAKVNAKEMEFEELVFDYKIRAVPTFAILKNGKMIEKFTGYTEKAKLEKVIDQLL
jgi:thioredoxin-like negative regulator of GroEL